MKEECLHSNFTSKKTIIFIIKSVILHFLKISTTITSTTITIANFTFCYKVIQSKERPNKGIQSYTKRPQKYIIKSKSNIKLTCTSTVQSSFNLFSSGRIGKYEFNFPDNSALLGSFLSSYIVTKKRLIKLFYLKKQVIKTISFFATEPVFYAFDSQLYLHVYFLSPSIPILATTLKI